MQLRDYDFISPLIVARNNRTFIARALKIEKYSIIVKSDILCADTLGNMSRSLVNLIFRRIKSQFQKYARKSEYIEHTRAKRVWDESAAGVRKIAGVRFATKKRQYRY